MFTADQWIGVAAVAATLVGSGVTIVVARRRRKVDPVIEKPERPVIQNTINLKIENPPPRAWPAAEPAIPAPQRSREAILPPPPSAPVLGLLPRVIGAPPAVHSPPASPPRQSPPPKKEPRTRPTVEEGPYEVHPRGGLVIPLDAEANERVVGHLDGDADFEYRIVNAQNYRNFRNGEDYSTVKYGEGDAVYELDWKVRGKGPFYLILEIYGKKNPREVDVQLETIS